MDHEQNERTARERLFEACVQGRAELVEKLLSEGAHIDERDENGRTLAMVACLKGHSNVLRVLMLRSFDQSAQDNEGRDIGFYLARFGFESDEQRGKMAAFRSLMIFKEIRTRA